MNADKKYIPPLPLWSVEYFSLSMCSHSSYVLHFSCSMFQNIGTMKNCLEGHISMGDTLKGEIALHLQISLLLHLNL